MSAPASAVSACLTFDFDGMSSWVTTARSDNPSMISRGEYAVVGMDRVLRLLAEYGIRGTFFVPGHTVLAFPTIVQRVRDEGHELAHHGWAHENPADFDAAGELRVLEKGFAAFDRVVGVRPVGYRSPAWDLSPNSIHLLQDAGVEWDSSCMAGDFHPYYLRRGDVWDVDAPYRFGETTDFLELPVSWTLDDFPHFEVVPGVFNQLSAPSKVFEIWTAEFDYLADNCPGGIFNLTLHPECIGRGHRIAGLRTLVDHMAARGARFESLSDHATRWRAQNPREAWLSAHPERTGVDAVTDWADPP